MSTKNQIGSGALYGLLGTLVMSIIMVTGMGTGISPIPEPIPVALSKLLLGSVSQPLLLAFGIVSHFGYGAFWGAVLFGFLDRSESYWYGIGLGVVLWLIMQLVVLPLLGWGVFGTGITPKVAVATLVLHLIYGGVVGWGLYRDNGHGGRDSAAIA